MMSNRRPVNDALAGQLSLFSMPDVVPQGDGSYRVIPRKPVLKCSIADAARMTGAKRDNIYKLIAADMIAYERPSPRKTLVILESLREHLVASSQPEYWNQERQRRYFGKK